MGICLFFPNTIPPRPPCYTISKWKSKANLTPLYFFLKQSNIHLSLCSVQFSHSVVSDYLWPHGLQHARLPCPSLFPRVCSNSHVRWVSDAIQWSHPLLSLLLLPSVFPSIRGFSSELAICIRWPKYWSFSLSISPSNEYSELFSFRIDWFHLAVQGTLKHLL